MTPPISVVSPDWLAETDAVVVDVREEREYREVGHIPDAVSIPYEEFRDPGSVTTGKLPTPADFASLMEAAAITPGDPLLAHDGDGGVYAARFLLTAAVFGHEGDLALLDGGFDAWRQTRDIERGQPTTDPSGHSSTYPVAEDAIEESDLVVDRDEVEAAVEGDATLVDTRTVAEYEQSHIPGAVQVSWAELLDDTDRLRPAAAIEELLAERGIHPEDRIVLYCNTARRLSHTLVVLAHLGFSDLAFYEGSLTDWVRASSPDWQPRHLKERVRALAPQGFDALPAELGEDVFGRLHLIGMYTQKQEGYFMLRTKVPCGRLTAEQARTVGEIAAEFATAPPEHGGTEQNPEFGDGFLDITTRQGLQLHWIEVEDMPTIWDRYEAVGLTTVQASGNTLRNVVTCPAAGLADEVTDVIGHGEAIADRFEDDIELANLPRKLKVSLSGCHENCGRAEIQDIGFVPAVKDDRDGFHVKVGGGLSDGPRAATDLGIFLEPHQLTHFSVAVAALFIDQGSYLDTAVNRLKFIVAELGLEQFRAELERYVDFEFEPAGESLTTDYRGDHVGVHRQDDGDYYIGLNVPTGRMRGTDLIVIADRAERFAGGELRTTPNQNLLVPDVPDDQLSAFLDHPIFDRYSPDPGPFERGIVTCTGSEFCSYGVIETKTRGLRWARRLEEWLTASDQVDRSDLPAAIRIHMSGCSASCAQPQVGDVGLRGERCRDDTREVPAADVGLGGDLSRERFIEWIAGSVPLSEIPAAIERTIAAYEAGCSTDESLSKWLEAQPPTDLRALVTGEAQSQPAAVEIEEV